MNERPASLFNLFTYLFRYKTIGSQWFGVNIGFSNEHQIFKGYGAKKLEEF